MSPIRDSLTKTLYHNADTTFVFGTPCQRARSTMFAKNFHEKSENLIDKEHTFDRTARNSTTRHSRKNTVGSIDNRIFLWDAK